VLEDYRKEFLEIGLTEDEALLHALIKARNRLLLAGCASESQVTDYNRRILEASARNTPSREPTSTQSSLDLQFQLRRLIGKGDNVPTAARILHISRSTAYSRLSSRRRPITRQQRRELLPKLNALLAQGYDVRTASQELGIPEVTAYRWRKRYLTPALFADTDSRSPTG
jgi:transcriptional regulator of acetoin/glycerol metabolism